MIRKIIVFCLVMLFVANIASCGEKKVLHCDKCNAEIEVSANSNMNEEWGMLCGDCNEEVFGKE